MPAPRKKSPTDGSAPGIVHELCWAKTRADGSPGLSVRDHCLNVGCVAEAFTEQLPPQLRAIVPAGIAALAALHDVGKVSPGFQAKCPAWLVQNRIDPSSIAGSETDHAKVSQHTLQERLPDPLRLWAAIVGAHHGRVKGERVTSIAESRHAEWSAERNRLVRELTDVFGDVPLSPGVEATLWASAGLITVSDWIGSDEALFPQAWTAPIEARRKRGRDALSAVGWESPTLKGDLRFSDLFPEFQANQLQTASWENITEPGLYIIQGQMGCGKTEAALAAAYKLMSGGRNTGLYFALPTQITSNRIHVRVREFLERALEGSSEFRLIHGASWLTEPSPIRSLNPSAPNDPESNEHVRAGYSWFASAKRALLAPFGVGTVDQALLGIVAAKHFFVRQLGLAGKVVILDEIHSYDLYTSTLIDTLIQRLLELKATVIVLSATLTHDRHKQLLALAGVNTVDLSTAYPLLSGMSPSLQQHPVESPISKTIFVSFPSAESLIVSSLERAQRGECVLWIRNTVAEAQETFSRLKSDNREGGPSLALLHARFPYFRREELENDWMDRLGKDGTRRPQNGCVLVSTQVTEQSVDIDADLLITDLAPTDMLLQRLGRVWRHERARPSERPEVWIRSLTLDDDQLRTLSARELQHALGKSARVYAPYVLLRSWREWKQRKSLALPNDIRAILEATYSEVAMDEPSAWRELKAELEKRKSSLSAKALNATNVWFQPVLPDEEGVQTRLNQQPTASLLLAREAASVDSVSVRLALLNGGNVTASGWERNIDTARSLHRNLVRMPRWAIAAGIGSEPDWLRRHVSQPTAVGIVKVDGTIVFWPGGEESMLSYCPERGVLIARGSRRASTPKDDWDEDESFD